MKKNIVRIAALALVVVMLGALTACSLFGGGKPSGIYKVKTLDGKAPREYYKSMAESYGMTFDEYLDAAGLANSDLDNIMTYTFNDDGTGLMKVSGASYSGTFTWELDGSTLKITGSDGTVTGEYKNDSIMFVNSGTTFVLGK
jgi:hypothetical protein